MTKRALIIQSDYEPLASFQNSTACIEQVLRSRSFELERCEGPGATRAGILQAYDGLIARASDGDTVVIYYTGHGGLTTNQQYTPGADLPRYIQHICPTDFARTTDDDFRGISSFELSLQLAALTRKTKNATMILECCFAAQLARGDEPAGTARVRPKLTRVVLTRHLQTLRERSRNFDELELTGNPHAVRVAAAGQTDSAYQLNLPSTGELRASGLDLPAGGWIGGMTLRLAEILAQIGTASVSWRSIAAELRARLSIQRPEIEGPIARVPFSLATVEAGTFPVRSARGTATLEAGRLHGVSVGDVYGVMPAGSTRIDPVRLIEQLTIDEVHPMLSRAQRTASRDDASELPANAVAIARSLAFERLPVRVVANDATRPVIEFALQSSGRRVRAATPRDHDVLAELRVRGTELELHDAQGPLFAPAHYPECLRDAVADLENLATEHRLHTLSGDEGLAPADVLVELLLVGDTGYRTLADHGEALGLRDRIALRLENRSARPVFANVFNLGLRRRIALLSAQAASGLKLPPNTPVYVGDTPAGQLVGLTLGWPQGMPRDQPRLDTAMVMITTEPADLSMLVTSEYLAASQKTASPPTPLGALLDQLATGRPRNLDAASGASAFAICWRDYRLFPLDASLDFGAPQVDANPTGSAPPHSVTAKLQIRLTELAVAAGTRVDALVCARSAAMPYCATTVIGSAPSELTVWRGELHGPADLYVWTSPDRGDRRTLADLLASRPITGPVAMLSAPDGEPQSRLATGASLELAAMARATLLGLTPDVATAFRGSFGGDDPSTDCYSAASVAFAIAIDRLGS
jgi:caspase domain-containing protein